VAGDRGRDQFAREWVRVLRTLGLGEAVDRYAAVLRRWGFFDQQGALLCETDLEELWRDVGPCLAVTRVRLQEALLTGAAAVPHRLGVSLKTLTQEDKRVRVSFSDGRSSDYDLVVGADGIYSTVRELAVNSSSPSYAGPGVWTFPRPRSGLGRSHRGGTAGSILRVRSIRSGNVFGE